MSTVALCDLALARDLRPDGRTVRSTARGSTPLFGDLDARKLRVPQGPRTGIAAIFGKWPGDESDDELDEAMRSLS